MEQSLKKFILYPLFLVGSYLAIPVTEANYRPNNVDDDRKSISKLKWSDSLFIWSKNKVSREIDDRKRASAEPVKRSRQISVPSSFPNEINIDNQPIPAEVLPRISSDGLLSFTGEASQSLSRKKLSGYTSFVDSTTDPLYQSKLLEEIVIQRAISYVGLVATGMFYDLDYELDFGYSESWSLARGSTVTGSMQCKDGGGYDLSVTRDSVSFTKLAGTITADRCSIHGITISGTATFSYEDTYYFQDAPLQQHPLSLNFSNVSISDLDGRVFSYSGSASCDALLNNRSYSDLFTYHDEAFGKYAFGAEHDGDLIYIRAAGSFYDTYGDSSGWQQQQNGLNANLNGETGIYALGYDNCDIKNTTVNHSDQSYTIIGSKYIASGSGTDYIDDGYAIWSRTREQTKLRSYYAPTGMDAIFYAYNVTDGKLIYSNFSSQERSSANFRHPTLGTLNFTSEAGSPGSYNWATFNSGLESGQTWQTDFLYMTYLSKRTNDFSADNAYTPWSEENTWSMADLNGDYTVDLVTGWKTNSRLWTNTICGWDVERYQHQGLKTYTELKLYSDGACRGHNGFYLDTNDQVVFTDNDGDGINELFHWDDDSDGYADTNDAFPLDASEWLDTDGDLVGNNTDADDDGDGVNDSLDAFPIDASETLDTDSDGTGDNADSDDDGDGVADLSDKFPLDATENSDSDNDGIGDNADAFPLNSNETLDTDSDGIGNNEDSDDDGDGFSDDQEIADGTDPLSKFSCKAGCFSFDVDQSASTSALTDGLLVIRYLFGFTGSSLVANATGSSAVLSEARELVTILQAAESELDIDGNGSVTALTDGLLLIRYLFGFSGDSLVKGAVASDASRTSSADIESYIGKRIPSESATDSNTSSDGATGNSTSSSDDFASGVFRPAEEFENFCGAPRTGIDSFTGQSYPDQKGSFLDESNWIRSLSNDLYLWYDEINDVDPAQYGQSANQVAEYFSLMKSFETTASGNSRDKFHFTYDTDEWRAYSQSGVTAGYGAEWVLLSGAPPRKIVVAYTEPNSPATTGTAGLARGAEVLKADGVDVIYGTDTDTLNAAFFPSNIGETHTFEVRDLGSSNIRTISMTSDSITIDPVQNVKTISTPTGTVGYLTFNNHIATAEKELFDAFTELSLAGVDDLVLDLRYNSGGYLAIASQLAYMIAGPSSDGETFELTRFNDKHPTVNPITGTLIEPLPFLPYTIGLSMDTGQYLPYLSLSRVYVLTSADTCSASEAVINGLRGLDIEVVQIGGTTCGKPYGFYGLENCGTTYFTIQFKGVNAKGFGDYPDGFSPSNLSGQGGVSIPGCSVDDDFNAFLGDENESMLSAALNYRSGAGVCPSQDLSLARLKKGLSFPRVGTSPVSDALSKPNFPGRIAIDLNP